jgi:Zn-finger nucleic acid-binding protein
VRSVLVRGILMTPQTSFDALDWTPPIEEIHVSHSYLCPVDQTPLQMSERQGVEIDYCPTCRGVWLDRGELDKIIEKNAAAPLAPNAPPQPQQPWPGQPPASGYHRHDQRPHKRRKSFLEELFD